MVVEHNVIVIRKTIATDVAVLVLNGILSQANLKEYFGEMQEGEYFKMKMVAF